jgi:hypothetical protein
VALAKEDFHADCVGIVKILDRIYRICRINKIDLVNLENPEILSKDR